MKTLLSAGGLPITNPAFLAFQEASLQAAAPVVRALMECDEELRTEALELFGQLAEGDLDDGQRHATLALLAEILFPNSEHTGAPGLDLEEAETIAQEVNPEAPAVISRMNNEEAAFASRLREAMEAGGFTQAALAEKVGVGQPAISMMLNRACRPQRRTVARLAEALGVSAEGLWPGYCK